MRTLYIAIVLAAAMGVIGCGGTKKSAVKTDTEISTAERYLKLIEYKEDTFSTLQILATVDVKSPDFNGSGTAIVRLKKDSILWASIRKFGFELMRLKVTQDSFYLLNRIQKEYVKMESDKIYQLYAGLKMDFNQLQKILLGLPPVRYNIIKPAMLEENRLTINGKGAQRTKVFLNYTIPEVKPSVSTGTLSDGSSFKMKNEEMEDLDKIHSFPNYRNYNFTENGDIYEVEMLIKQADTEMDLNFPFSVPSHYNRS